MKNLQPANYIAFDGINVRIPPAPALRDGPMPVFDETDRVWLDQLIAFRDKAISYDARIHMPNPDVDWSDMDPETAELIKGVAAAQAEQGRDLTAQQSARSLAALDEFGADGAGFLDQLNDGRALHDFWGSLNRLLCQRIPLMRYNAPEEHQIVRDLLLRFPERIWVPIVAQICWPKEEHRKSRPISGLMNAYLTSAQPDFRNLEHDSPNAPLDKQTEKAMLAAMANKFMMMESFRSSIIDADAPADPADLLKKSQALHAALNTAPTQDMTDEQAALLRGLLLDMEPSRTHEAGYTQSEINKMKSDVVASVSAQQKRGNQRGYFLKHALQYVPQGFYRINLGDYPSSMVWPYIASNFDILDRALGIADPDPWDAQLEPAKAISTLALLPKLPARYADAVFDIAVGPAKKGRAEAQSLLKGATAFVGRASALLDDKKPTIRAEAARTLAAIADPSALSALRERATKEKSQRVKAALEDAIGVLDQGRMKTVSDPDYLTEYDPLTIEIDPKVSWLADKDHPELSFQSGERVPPHCLIWLLNTAVAHGSPVGSAYVDTRLNLLSAEARQQLGTWVLAAWCAYDAQPYPPEEMKRVHDEALNEAYSHYTMFWDVRENFANQPEYQGDTPMTKAELAEYRKDAIAYRAQMFINWKPYLFSGMPSKGLLSLARHADAARRADLIKNYLADHGKRTAQCKALMECLNIADCPISVAFLSEVAKSQKQKGLRQYALKLLG